MSVDLSYSVAVNQVLEINVGGLMPLHLNFPETSDMLLLETELWTTWTLVLSQQGLLL